MLRQRLVRRAVPPLRETDVRRRDAGAPAVRRTVCERPCPDSSLTPQQRSGATGQSNPVEPDLLDKWVLGSNERAPRRRRVLDKLQVVASPRVNVGLKARQSLMQVGRLDVVDHYQKVDVRVAVGIAASHGPKEPGTVEVGPRGEPFAQSPDQLASQTGQSEHRPGGEVVPVQHNHRRSAGDRLAHQSSLDEFLDDGAGVAGSNSSSSSEPSPSDRLLEAGQRLEQRAADGRRNVKNR